VEASELSAWQIVASPLIGNNDTLIPAPALYRTHYVSVSQSSPQSPLAAGEYPDALAPLSFPPPSESGGGRVTQPFWLDCFVPIGTPPGDYRGTVTLAHSSGKSKRLSYSVHVWDFELPRLPAFQSSIFIVWRRIAEVHGFDREANHAVPRLRAILDAYYDMLVQHRLSPHEVWATYPDAEDPLSDASWQSIERALRHHLLVRQAGTIGLPLWEQWPFVDPLGEQREQAMDYVVRYHALCAGLGCADRLYKIFGELDEPHDEAAYDRVLAWRRFFDELKERRGVSLPLLLTLQPMDHNESLGRVGRAADILAPHVSALWADVEGEGAQGITSQHVQQGGKLWTYTALVQAPHEWQAAHGWPKQLTHNHPPAWLLDYPVIHHRLLPWLATRYGVTGFTYWDVSHFPGGEFDPWKDGGSYPHPNGEVYNGDGLLIYPARQETHGYEGPVASMRLKWLRDAVDDFDYLTLMQQHGELEQAMQRGSTFARGLTDWDDNVEALMAARVDVGNRLERLEQLNRSKRDS
jgi:hypothetical protein